MKFDEFDASKSAKNKEIRGIDFVEAGAIWDDPNRVTVPARNVSEEVRSATVGMIQGKLWVALWTQRNGARIFSVHRAEGTQFERKYHEGQKGS